MTVPFLLIPLHRSPLPCLSVRGKTKAAACWQPPGVVDDTMMPYAYELTPGQERSDWLMAEIPEGSTSCTIAYQEYKTDGSKGDAYFVEAAL